MPDTSSPPLLSVRSAVILNSGLLAGIAAGLLAYAARHSLAEAVLAGVGVTGSSVAVLNRLIGRK